MRVRLLPFRVMPHPSSGLQPGPPPSLPQAQAPPPSHSLAGQLTCISPAGPFTILYLLPRPSRSVPVTLVLSAPKRESCGNPQMTPSASNSPSPSPAPKVPLCLPKAPSSGADSLAARRLGMARLVGTDSPKASSGRSAHEGKPGSRTARSAGAITGRTSGARLGPKAGLDARRPGLRGAPGRAGGGRGRGDGIPRRRRPAHPLARTPP